MKYIINEGIFEIRILEKNVIFLSSETYFREKIDLLVSSYDSEEINNIL